MKKESPKGFEYESKNLDYSSVESHICDYYDLGYADSSNFMELKPDGGQSITISATKGIISCWASAYKKSGENDLYLIAISCVSISRN
ncbi:hypothetical protein LI142_13700 [Eubacterium limosum]|uniref:hypothetical protein n=1 Tax=Eubacterium limosum TaxID=1736 RepID=UPI001D0807A1|nr:hypothetical protein [Eubacterium limosum]MCB6570554.1 hypothetical protein [Eubacterium limosum]